MSQKKHLFPYEWAVKNTKFEKDKGKVFSCFAAGGGSSFGYKLAGFDVLGFNELDPKMANCYFVNHHSRYCYVEDIRDFSKRDDLPQELYNLDILDGSPPCSSFSVCGNRESDWGKAKKFREGQKKQVLDTLFFDFINVAKKLQPKIVIAENVKGLLLGNAKKYVMKIGKSFDEAGYYVYKWLLDSSKMGVPQTRERVFFVAIRKDLATLLKNKITMFDDFPYLDLTFNEEPILYKDIEDGIIENYEKILPCDLKYYDICKPGYSIASVHPKGNRFNHFKLHKEKVPMTITGDNKFYHYEQPRRLTKNELIKIGSFPKDYNFLDVDPCYIIGMSVPPIMIAQIVTRIYNQWRIIFDDCTN